MYGPGGFLRSSRREFGVKSPPAPRPDPEPRPELEHQPQPRPETTVVSDAETPTRLPRGTRHLTDWAWAGFLLSVVLAALVWLSAPHICPSGDFCAPSPQNRGGTHGNQHEKATNMYLDAIRWMRYFQGQAGRNSYGDMALATRAAEVEERISRMAASTSTLKEKFKASGLDAASGLAYLEARLLRARDEASFYQDAAWPWLLRIGCVSCGRVTRTPPCPDHPVAVAIREIGEVMDVLVDINSVYGDLIKEHRDIQEGSLEPAYDDICASKQWNNPGAQGQPQLVDFRATAFGMCRLTARELRRGLEFRDEFGSRVGERLSAAIKYVSKFPKELNDIYPGFSWSPAHVDRGVAVLDSLLDVVTARIAGG